MCECSTGGKCSWVKEREDMARSTRFYNRSVRLQKEIAEHVKAAQQSVQPTGGTVPPLVEFLANPENYPTAEQGSRPTTSG